MDAGYQFFGRNTVRQAKIIDKIQKNIRSLQIQYFSSTSPYGNFIIGYDFTIRGKRQRDNIFNQVFTRKELPSIFQLVLKQEHDEGLQKDKEI